jgi:glycerophosphoryl diester phosphodiesterase
MKNIPLIQGHRGCPFVEPENTIECISKCVEIGCDSIEIDVFANSDEDSLKKLVVFHGTDGDKLHNIPEERDGNFLHYLHFPEDDELSSVNIQDLTMDIISESTLKPAGFLWFSNEFRNRSPPELLTFLEEVSKYDLKVTIELKGDNEPWKYVKKILEASQIDIRKISFSSFNHSEIINLKKEMPEITIEFLYDDKDDFEIEKEILFVIQNNGSQINLHYSHISKEVVEKIHQKKLKVMAWFNDPLNCNTSKHIELEIEEYKRILECNVDVLCVNHPDKLYNIISEYNKNQFS